MFRLKFFEIDRPPEGIAEILNAFDRAHGAGPVAEETVGVEALMAVIPIAAAVKGLRPALDRDVDGARRAAAVFGLVVAGEHLHFRDGVHIRLHVGSAVGPGIRVLHAIEREVDGRVAATVDVQSARPGTLRDVPRLRVEIHDARKRGDQGHEVAPADGGIEQLLPGDQAGALARGRLHGRNLRSHFDALLHLPHLHGDFTERAALAHAHRYVPHLVGPESGNRYFRHVGARQHAGEDEDAGLVRAQGLYRPRLLIRESDLRVGNDRAPGIDDCSRDDSADVLPKRGTRQQQDQNACHREIQLFSHAK